MLLWVLSQPGLQSGMQCQTSLSFLSSFSVLVTIFFSWRIVCLCLVFFVCFHLKMSVLHEAWLCVLNILIKRGSFGQAFQIQWKSHRLGCPLQTNLHVCGCWAGLCTSSFRALIDAHRLSDYILVGVFSRHPPLPPLLLSSPSPLPLLGCFSRTSKSPDPELTLWAFCLFS